MSEERDVLQNRRAKMEAWLEKSKVYRNDFRRQALADELQKQHADQDKAALAEAGVRTAVAGRVMLRRVMGKASFVTLQDVSGQIQCYLTKNESRAGMCAARLPCARSHFARRAGLCGPGGHMRN